MDNKKWEYAMIEKTEPFPSELSRLGLDGWELVAVIHRNPHWNFYIKRETKE